MGVSRSGRVRKKSSKLIDFQSPDDIDTRTLKRTNKSMKIQNHSMSTTQQQLHSPPLSIKMEPPLELLASSSGAEDSMQMDANTTSSGEDMDSSGDDLDNDNLSDQHQSMAGDGSVDPTVRKSIYMSEKASKKNFMKDGKMMVKKTQRKDKGKSRFTAYMLWAKQARQDMLYSNPDIDFATISRRLSEMWANVPNSEKYTYKRKAKRLASKGPAKLGKETVTTAATSRPSSKFLNKRGGKSTGDEALLLDHGVIVSPTKMAAAHGGGSKVSEIRPVDVAAHLKLLGDNLSIIGGRLKEHEGQITVSGSLSVLLDSLLCSVAPLMCLTSFVPELSGDQQIKQKLANTLDNIAYVMPGL